MVVISYVGRGEAVSVEPGSDVVVGKVSLRLSRKQRGDPRQNKIGSRNIVVVDVVMMSELTTTRRGRERDSTLR